MPDRLNMILRKEIVYMHIPNDNEEPEIKIQQSLSLSFEFLIVNLYIHFLAGPTVVLKNWIPIILLLGSYWLLSHLHGGPIGHWQVWGFAFAIAPAEFTPIDPALVSVHYCIHHMAKGLPCIHCHISV